MNPAHDRTGQIRDRLHVLERREDIRILLAVESGSRIWGFPAPDSDYDVRFLYVRPRDWYLALARRRDVLGFPLQGLLDINGWDIRKALNLLLKANPTLLEWLRSPIRYIEARQFLQEMEALASRVAFRRPARYHNLHLGRSAYRDALEGWDQVRLKKYLYALRPALALRWLRLRPEPPPMDMAGRCAGLPLLQHNPNGPRNVSAIDPGPPSVRIPSPWPRPDRMSPCLEPACR